MTTAPIWFVEELKLAKWRPATYRGDKPPTKTAGGHQRTFRAPPKKINPGHAYLDLDGLAAVYGVEGKFRGTGK